MSIIRGSLIDYFKAVTPTGTWFNCNKKKPSQHDYLFDILNIDGVSEVLFATWLRACHVSARHNEGANGIYVRLFSKSIHIAHGHFPDHKTPIIKPSRGAIAEVPVPHIPQSCLEVADVPVVSPTTSVVMDPLEIEIPEQPTPLPRNEARSNEHTTRRSSGASSSPIGHSDVPASTESGAQRNLNDMEVECDAEISKSKLPDISKKAQTDPEHYAASLFCEGEKPITISIGSYSVEVYHHKASSTTNAPLGFVAEILAASLMRTLEEFHSKEGNRISPRMNSNRGGKDRAYTRVTVGNGAGVGPRQQKRYASELGASCDTLTGGSLATSVATFGRALRRKPSIVHGVVKYIGVSLLHQMSPQTAAAMIEDCNINATAYQRIVYWLEAEFPEIRGTFPSKQKIRSLITKVASAIAMITGTMELWRKKGTNKKVDVAFVRVASVFQAFLVMHHQGYLSGKTALEGAPKGETWFRFGADAGGGRNNINGGVVIASEDSHVQSIREITTLGMYDAALTADDFANHNLAWWQYFADDFNALAHDTGTCRLYLGDEYIGSIFLRDYTPSLNPVLLVSEIDTALLDSLRKDGQTWVVSGTDNLALLTHAALGFVGVAAMSLSALGNGDCSRGVLEALGAFASSNSNQEAEFGDMIPFENILPVSLENTNYLQITGVYIFSSPVPIHKRNERALELGAFSYQVTKNRLFASGDGKFITTCVNGQNANGISPCQDCELEISEFSTHFVDFVEQNGYPVIRTPDRIIELATQYQRQLDLWKNGMLKKKPLPRQFSSCEHVPPLKVNREDRCLTPLHYSIKVCKMLFAHFLSICMCLDGQTEAYITRSKERADAEGLLVDMTALVEVIEKETVPLLEKEYQVLVNKAKEKFPIRNAKGVKERKNWGPTTAPAVERLVAKWSDGADKVAAQLLLSELSSTYTAIAEKKQETAGMKAKLKTLEKDIEDFASEDGERGFFEERLRNTLGKSSTEGGLAIDLRKYHGGDEILGRDGAKMCKRIDNGGSEVPIPLRIYAFDVLFTATRTGLEEKNNDVAQEKVQKAEIDMENLRRMFAEWSEIQRVMRITRFLCEEEIKFLETKPAEFVRLVRTILGIGKSKKLHEIEAHLGEFARRNKCVYVLSEENGESKHAEFNMRNRVYCRIQNMRQRLAVMTEMERFANSDIAGEAGSLLKALKQERKRGKYKPRKEK